MTKGLPTKHAEWRNTCRVTVNSTEAPKDEFRARTIATVACEPQDRCYLSKGTQSQGLHAGATTAAL